MPTNPDESDTGSEYEDEEPLSKSVRKRGKTTRNPVNIFC